MTFSQLLEKKYVIFDGAMGSELQKRGLKIGETPEAFNFTAPEKVAEVVRSYAEAGSDVVATNTFGANGYKLKSINKTVEEAVAKAVKIARDALIDYPEVLLAQDIGPIGKLLRPSGTLDFEEAYNIFAEQVKAGVKYGADLFVLQTFSDLLEIKAALLAVKENSRLPVICSATFESACRTFTGCPASAFALTLSGMGADVIGANCSSGPKELAPIISEFQQYTDLPLMFKPNAGLPDPITGEFGLNSEDFAVHMTGLMGTNVKIFGGCCGTSAEYIKLMKAKISENSPNFDNELLKKREIKHCAICSGTKTVVLNEPKIIGERINPTGKPRFKEALKTADINYVLGQALEQVKGGADILDVNVGLPEIDEKSVMIRVIQAVQGICDLPLQIDSSSPEVIEAALRRYSGKPIVNSVNGKEESLSTILPLVKKYGACVIALTLDEDGIPETAEKRLLIAEKILSRALSYGIRKEDVFIDCLTMTISTDPKAAETTLTAVKLVKEKLGLKTALGVSNVSFGLPQREVINSTFLTLALNAGLDLAIVNPNADLIMNSIRAYKALAGLDPNASDYIKAFSDNKKPASINAVIKELSLSQAILDGLKEEAFEIAEKLLKTTSSTEIIDGMLIPALDQVGERYEKGEIFLPSMILSAEAAGRCFEALKKNAPAGAVKFKGRILLATVKGDVHDIGKNIVRATLESYGYEVIDLGKDVAPELIVKTAIESQVGLVGLSALMTTTLGAMEETIKLLRGSEKPRLPVIVGGAVLNADYAKTIGADYYAKDAKSAADIVKALFGGS